MAQRRVNVCRIGAGTYLEVCEEELSWAKHVAATSQPPAGMLEVVQMLPGKHKSCLLTGIR